MEEPVAVAVLEVGAAVQATVVLHSEANDADEQQR